MKKNISDLMDRAAPVAVPLEEQPVCLDNIKARTLEKVRAEKTKKAGFRWTKVLLVAACAASLLLGTVVAGERGRSVLFPSVPDHGVEYYVGGGQVFTEGQVPDAFETVYLPALLPEGAQMHDAWYAGSRDSDHTGYQWGWQVGEHRMTFGQYWVESLPDRGIPVNDKTVRKMGQVALEGISVNYTQLLDGDNTLGWELVWFAEPYAFELIYTGSIPLEELTPVAASLALVAPQEWEALLKAYAPEHVHLARPALEPVLVPQKLAWSPRVEADAATFYLISPETQLQQVVFYQEDADCVTGSAGIPKRRVQMRQSRDLVSAQLAGQPVQLLDGRNAREYFWEQEGNWCYLRIEPEAAAALGLTVEELAGQIAESLEPIPWNEAHDALK